MFGVGISDLIVWWPFTN